MTAERSAHHGDDPVSGRESGDVGPDRHDYSRSVRAQDGPAGTEHAEPGGGEHPETGREVASASPVIADAHRARVHPDEHLAGLRRGDSALFEAHDIRCAEVAVDGGGHGRVGCHDSMLAVSGMRVIGRKVRIRSAESTALSPC